MAFAYYDRVKETSTTTGTGTITLAGAATGGFRTFTSVFSNSDTMYYCITDQNGSSWEVGLGTFTTSGTTLARTTVIASSNSNSAVNFTSGALFAFVTLPTAALPTASGVTGSGAMVLATAPTINQPNSVGTTTNDNASSGSVGECLTTNGNAASATVTISNASPAVISDSAAIANTGTPDKGITVGSVINFTTSGGLPTGLSVGTNYYVIAAGFTAGVSYQVSATPFGTAINTSSAGSGTHTRVANAILSNATPQNIAAISLTAGDWDVRATSYLSTTGITTQLQSLLSTTSNSTTTGALFLSVYYNPLSVSAGESIITPNGDVRISISGTTSVYLVGNNGFSTGTSFGTGSIQARRIR